MHTPSDATLVRAPLIGREPELEELDDALARALGPSESQALTIIGGAGVGKTRLIDEFIERIRNRERRVRCYRGVGREAEPAFGIIQRLLRHRFSIVEGADPEVQRDMVRKEVSEVLGDRRVTEVLHFLGTFLDLRWPDSPFTRAFEADSQQLTQIGHAVLRRFFEVDAERSPLVLVFEDIHFASDESLDLLRSLINSLEGAPVLLIATARPELLTRRPDWVDAQSGGGTRVRHWRMELAPLAPDDAAQLMTHWLAPVGEPPQELIDAAVDIAGGNPYLLEQMWRTFLSAQVLVPSGEGAWQVNLDRLDDAQLPLSVEDAIAARIAALSPAERALLERASVMGAVFWTGALVSLGRLDRKVPELWGGAEDLGGHYRDLLSRLTDRDYVVPVGESSLVGEEEYVFKHNLEREAISRLTSAAQLRRMHRDFAEWLELRLFRPGESERAEEHCEMLGSHYERGGEARKAAEYFLAAGDRARARHANLKAADYYSKGLSLLGDHDVVRRLDAYHQQGDVLQLAGRNDEALSSFRKMLEIAWRLDLKAKGGAAHNRIGRVYRAIGQLEEAMRHLGTGHALFDAAGDSRGVASSLDDVGKVHWMRGAYGPAERFMKQSLEIRRELGDPRSIALSLNNLGLVYQDSGRFEDAKASLEEALSVRREIEDVAGIAQTLNNIATIEQDHGQHAAASKLWEEALEHATAVGDRMRQGVVLTNLGESLYRQGQPAAAIETLSKAQSLASTLGDRILEGEVMRGLAKAHMLSGDLSEARDYIVRSVELFQRARSKPFLGVALRTAGEIAAQEGLGGEQREYAAQCFSQSIHLFEELGNEMELARSFEVYARFLETDPEESTDVGQPRRATVMRERAEEIRARLRAPQSERGATPESEVTPLEGERTHPGTAIAD